MVSLRIAMVATAVTAVMVTVTDMATVVEVGTITDVTAMEVRPTGNPTMDGITLRGVVVDDRGEVAVDSVEEGTAMTMTTMVSTNRGMWRKACCGSERREQ